MLKSETITLVESFFADVRISEFWNIDSRCYVIIPKLELSGQNPHLRPAFHLLEICWTSWSVIQPAALQKRYFQGYLFLQNTISNSS